MAKSRICMNRPTLACDSDAECTSELCVSGDCQAPGKEEDGPWPPPATYGFKDFDITSCTSDADCGPPGICQAPVLRYAVRGTPPTDTEPTITPTLERVYLLTADPDEKRDLLSTPGDDLDVRVPMRSKVRQCMAGWDLWKPGEAATACSSIQLKYGG
jgi:hypothetical protein